MEKETLYQKLLAYTSDDYYPFHMPGHKRNTEMLSMINPYGIDITEIDGFDNLHEPEDVILRLMDKISGLYKTKASYLLVNGSTCGILAAISAVTFSGDEIAIARNCHKSVYNAVLLNRLNCHYIRPKVKEYGIFSDITPKDVKELFEKNNNIKAVVITSPTYEGIVSDIKRISEIVHSYNAVLIVDEAHGAHLIFDDYFPKSAVESGADIVIQSVHKTLPSMTQTALLHIAGDRVDKKRVEKFLSIYQSSSPSYVLMSSVDKCFEILENQGKSLFSSYICRLKNFYTDTAHLRKLKIFLPQDCFDFDKGKIVIISKDEKFGGMDLYKRLLDKYHLQMEMASEHYVIAMTSICDTKEGFYRLKKALLEIDEELDTAVKNNVISVDINSINEADVNSINEPGIDVKNINEKKELNEKKYELYETEKLKKKVISLKESEGKVSGEYIYLYPPGCPILVPGEIISRELINRVNIYLEKGLRVSGINNKNIEIIDE